MKFIAFIALFIAAGISFSQTLDVQSYDLTIQISDKNDSIKVVEEIEFMFMSKSPKAYFDLKSRTSDGKGMTVDHILYNDKRINYTHENDQLAVDVSSASKQIEKIQIHFSGIPDDGLIIGKNMYKNRTFFGDNWPNRAHHWFACVDHPSDKATIKYSIIAPKHYEVVANGAFLGKTDYASDFSLHVFESKYVLPTKVMVFGAADFSVQELKEFTRFPLSSWVYPENEKEGFYDLELAIDVLNFFEAKIADYPYEKLANVQSTTRYGGMENAGCIFYAEQAFSGKRLMENLIAHEIAHQWFGNSASETDWDHLWLSEGFATYMTHLYIEQKYGRDQFVQELLKDRKTVLQFYRGQHIPVVDTISTDMNFMLNANAYQRGSWVLHMLRSELGDVPFWQGIQAYYTKYKYSNATTSNFIDVLESTSGKDLTKFEQQWLRTGIIPKLDLSWKLKGKNLTITLFQKQQGLVFELPLELKIYYADGTQEIITTQFNQQEQTIELNAKDNVNCIEIDPNVKLLFEL